GIEIIIRYLEITISFFIFANIVSIPNPINVKKYLFISILFLLPFCLSAQSKKSIDSFMDIPFGSDSATVKAAIIAKGGSIRSDSQLDKGELEFVNFPMSQRHVSFLLVKFVNNKAY